MIEAGRAGVSFEYHRPTSWEQAIQLVGEPGAIAKMGGCDVMTRYRRGELRARLVVGLNNIPGVTDLTNTPEGVRIGPAVTLRQLEGDAGFRNRWPIIADVVGSIASPAIRNSATVIGNIAQGWSVSDIVPLFAICDAELRVLGPSEKRGLTITEYANSSGTKALRNGELITALHLPTFGTDFRIAYERFSFRNAFDLPLVSVAIGASIRSGIFENVRIAAVGGSRMPSRCPQVEAVMQGRGNDENTWDKAAAAILQWADPISDFRASADYRRHLLTVMFRRALLKLVLQ